MKINFESFSKDHLIFSKSLRDDFFSHNYQGEQLLESARAIVSVHFIRSLESDINGKKIFSKLIRSGYNTNEIIDSIAEAWIKEKEYFEIRDPHLINSKNFLYRNLIIPIILSLVSAFIILFILYIFYINIFLEIFVAPPLVVALCMFLFFIFYKIFKIRK